MKYVYVVISKVDVEYDPKKSIDVNGLLGIHSSAQGAYEHYCGIKFDRRKKKDFELYWEHMNENEIKDYEIELWKCYMTYYDGIGKVYETLIMKKWKVSQRKKK